MCTHQDEKFCLDLDWKNRHTHFCLHWKYFQPGEEVRLSGRDYEPSRKLSLNYFFGIAVVDLDEPPF